MIRNTFCERVDAAKLIPSDAELKLRLGGYKGSDEFTEKLISECRDELFLHSDPRYCGVLTDAYYPEEGKVDIGFGIIESRDLYKNLDKSESVFVFCATLGSANERRLNMLSRVSKAKYYVFDALSSAYAEALCDHCENVIKGGMQTRPRFSPGYGDLALSVQRPLLDYINAGRLIGITLSKSFLMTPNKTVTAIMGVKNEY